MSQKNMKFDHYWSFDTNNADIVGGGGSIGSSVTAGGKNGNYSGSLSSFASASLGDFSHSNFTLSFWSRNPNTGSIVQQVGFGPNTSTDLFWFSDGGAGQSFFGQATGGSYRQRIFAASHPTNNTWFHVVCGLNGDTLFFYLNGSLVGTGAGSNWGSGWACALRFITGPVQLDEIGFINKALSASQIAGLYAGGAGKFGVNI